MTAQIHKFRVFDKNLVLDVNSGSVLQVDDLAYEILEYYDIYSQDVIFKKLKNKYSKLNIKETFEEIQTLKEQGYLFTDINLIPILDKLHTKQYVKALCLNVA